MPAAPGYDVAVIGAGLLGASTAYWLARAGARVALLDAVEAGGGASGNSFAWLNAEHKQPDSYHHLNVAGMADYAILERDAGVTVHRSGALHWPAAAGEEEVLEAWCRRLQGLGYPARWLMRVECIQREPGLRLPAAADHALALDGDAWVDPPAVIGRLLEASGDAVHLYEHAPVTAFHHAGATVSGVRAGEHQIGADVVVVCAGVGTALLTELIGAAIPVQRRPGLLLVTTPVPPGTLQRVVYHGLGADHDLHLRPDTNGGTRIGSDATDRALAGEPSGAHLQSLATELLRRATEVLPALREAAVERVHLGVRPVPGGGLTVAGWLPGVDNAYVAVTHSGVTLGPLLGRLIAGEVTGGEPARLLADFRPDRFTR